MQFLTRSLPPFLICWLLTFTLASLFHSQYVVNQLVNLGVVITVKQRLTMMFDDWLGLLPTYGLVIAIAFLIAFFVASWIYRRLSQYKTLLFVLAGILAFIVVLIAIESIMNIHVIAGARGWGFYAQLLAGATGGYVFAKLSH